MHITRRQTVIKLIKLVECHKAWHTVDRKSHCTQLLWRRGGLWDGIPQRLGVQGQSSGKESGGHSPPKAETPLNKYAIFNGPLKKIVNL